MPVDVVLVVVSYNSSHVIGGLLDTIPAALSGLTADVVVVDNDSTDDSREMLRTRSDCRVVESTNVGYAGGVNRGVAEAAPSDIVIVLNPDVRLQPRSLRTMVDILRRTGASIVAPRLLGATGELALSLRREPTIPRALGLTFTRWPWLSEYVSDAEAYESPCAFDWAVGAVLGFTRECFDALGGWDASYFLYSEETDFCLRARDQGLRSWYEPTAVTLHIGGESGRSPLIYAMQVLNRLRLYSRRHSSRKAYAYLFLLLLREALRAPRNADARAAFTALLLPTRRPPALSCGPRLLPS